MSAHHKPLSDNLVHVATMLVVSDLETSVTYYRDNFGFEVLEQQPYVALLAREPMLLYLVTESEPTPDKPSVTLALSNTPECTSVNLVFRVKNCQQAYLELSERGVQFLTPPQSPSWGGWRCFTRDPDGYLIELEQPS